MIANKYIEQALNIRKNYTKVMKEMANIQKDLETTSNKLFKIKDDLTLLTKNLEGQELQTIKEKAIEHLNKVEAEGDKLRSKYEPLNEELESLKKQEITLYDEVVSTYPKLSEEEIVSEFRKHIKPIA